MVGAGSGSLAFFAASVLCPSTSVQWLLASPALAVSSVFYLLLAKWRRTGVFAVVGVLWLGGILGTLCSLGPELAFYQKTGWWCGGIEPGAHLSDRVLLREAVARGLPHIAAILVAGLFLARRGPLVLLPLVGVVAGVLGAVSRDALFFGTGSIRWTSVGVLGYGTMYAVFVPLAAWLAERMSEGRGPVSGGIWPAKVCAWFFPPLVLLIQGAILPSVFLNDPVQSWLLPVIPIANFVRSYEYGLSPVNVLQYAGLCMVALGVGGCLCYPRPWGWLPWLLWLLHDLAFCGASGWAAWHLLQNVSIGATQKAESSWVLSTWPTFIFLTALGWTFTMRWVGLIGRGGRPGR